MFLMSHDEDGFNRWDAGQRLAVDVISSLVGAPKDATVEPRLVTAYRHMITDSSLDQALVAKMLQLPSEAYLIELADSPDVQQIHRARQRVLNHLALSLRDELVACYRRNRDEGEYLLTPEAIARRSLRNTALGWLLQVNDEEARELAIRQYREADNMTDRMGALRALVNSDYEQDREQMLTDFYQQWQADPQVVEQWFSVQSGSSRAGTLAHVQKLTEHPAFDWKNPNKIRSVVGVFAGQNLAGFHAADGSGYRFLAEQVLRLDASNPQIAARLVTPLTRWKKFATEYGSQMKAALQWINAGGDESRDLSKDLYEVVHKSLQD